MDQRYSHVGHANLTSIEDAHNFTNWLYDEIRPYLHGSILEVGSGTGTYSRNLVEDFPHSSIVLSDLDQGYVANLTNTLGNERVSARVLDLGEPAHFADLKNRFDTIIALNVLEHVLDDKRALANVHESLKEGGTAIVLVPAHKALYNRIDAAIGHHRRYTKRELVDKAQEAGFSVEKVFYFNALSILGWYLNGNILKKENVGGGLLSLYNALVPFVRVVERVVLRRRFGISLIVVLRKS